MFAPEQRSICQTFEFNGLSLYSGMQPGVETKDHAKEPDLGSSQVGLFAGEVLVALEAYPGDLPIDLECRS